MKGRPVRSADIEMMTQLADAGFTAREIADRSGWSLETVYRHISHRLVHADALRKARTEELHCQIANAVAALPYGAPREGLVKRFGLASKDSLKVLAHRGRKILAQRQSQGIISEKAASARRPAPQITTTKIASLREMASEGLGVAEIAEIANCGRATVSRYAGDILVRNMKEAEAARRARMQRLVQANDSAICPDDREEIARRFGLAGRRSLSVRVVYAKRKLAGHLPETRA